MTEPAAPIAPVDSPRPPGRLPWYRHAGHWYSLVGTVAALALGVALLDAWTTSRRITGQIESESASITRNQAKKDQLTADKNGFESLLEKNLTQRQQIVSDIANFQNELNVLTRKTAQLEQVRDDLKRLEAAYAQYREVEELFTKDLELLGATVRKGGT